MLRFHRCLSRRAQHEYYNKRQIQAISEGIKNSKEFTVLEIPEIAKGLPTLQQLRLKYPDAKSPEPTIFDHLSQKSYDKLRSMTYTGNRGWSKELLLQEQGRTFEFPIDSSKTNFYDEKIPVEEENVDFSEHIDFVEKNLKQFYFDPKRHDPSNNQLYYFLEAVGQGLAKNPYMTLNEKLDEIARYVQYFLFKKDIITGVQLLSRKNLSVYQNSSFATRKIKKDHWTKPGYNPRHSWRHQLATPYNIQRPEYFWLSVKNEKDRQKLKAVFGENCLLHGEPFVAKPGVPVESRHHKAAWGEDVVRITHLADDENFMKFDFDSVEYKQVQVEDDHFKYKSQESKRPYKTFRETVDADGKKIKNVRDLPKGGSSDPKRQEAEFIDQWYMNKRARKRKAKRARQQKSG